jgi:hypothetical protein
MLNECLRAVACKNYRRQERRIHGTSAGHVVNLDQCAGLVEDRDGTLNADIYPEMRGHAAPESASNARPARWQRRHRDRG